MKKKQKRTTDAIMTIDKSGNVYEKQAPKKQKPKIEDVASSLQSAAKTTSRNLSANTRERERKQQNVKIANKNYDEKLSVYNKASETYQKKRGEELRKRDVDLSSRSTIELEPYKNKILNYATKQEDIKTPQQRLVERTEKQQPLIEEVNKATEKERQAVNKAANDYVLAKYQKNVADVDNKDIGVYDKTLGAFLTGVQDIGSNIVGDNKYIDENGNTVYLPNKAELTWQKTRDSYGDNVVGKLARFGGDVAHEGGKIATTALLNAPTGGIAGSALYFSDIFGDQYKQNINEGYSEDKAGQDALLKTGQNYIKQRLIGGLGGKLTGSGPSWLEKSLTNTWSKAVSNPVISKTLASMSSEAIDEFTDEWIESAIDSAVLGKDFDPMQVFKDSLYSGAIGGATGAFGGIGDRVTTSLDENRLALQELNTIADQRIQQIQEEVQQDPSRAQEATQEIQDIQNYVQAQTNIIQNQAQTQAQESETTQPNAIAQQTQNVAQNEQNEGTQESTFNNEEKPKNVGVHYGDLGKARDTYYWNINSSNRSTGHYGTGTYFVSNEESDRMQSSSFTRSDRPKKEVDFDDYNLYKPLIESEAKRLHDGLKAVNYNKYDDFDYRVMVDDLKRNGITQEQIDNAKNAVEEARQKYEQEGYNDKYDAEVDSLSTVFMKNLGFDGIDVRGLEGYDNTGYGSVIYDLKNNNVETNQNENIPATKENVINEEAKQQQETTNETVNQNNEEQQEATETPQQEEKTQPEILDKMPTEKKSTIKSLKKGIDTFRKEITDRFAAVYDMAQKTRNKTLYHKADRILASDGMAQVDIDTNQVNLNGKPYKNFTDENGNKVSMSLEQAYDIYNKIPNKDKNTFLVNQLNIDRLNQGVDQFEIPMEDSERTIAQLREKYPDIDKWSENIYQYYRNLQDKMVESGRVSQELADKWRTETPHYVHIQRDVQNKGNTGVSVKNGKIDSDNLIRKVKGGTYAILPIKDTTAKFTQNVTRAITYNDFGKEYARTIGYDSQGNNATEVDMDEMFGLDPEFVNNNGNGNYTMKLYENGGIIEVPISEDVYKSLSPQNIPRVGVLAEATTLYKDLLTNKNPFFGFLRNPIKDAQDMFLYSKHPLAKSMATYTKLFAGRTALRNRAITRDGVTAQDIVDFYHNTGNAAHSIYKNGQFDSKNRVKESVDKVLSPIEKGNDFMESMPRITEFWNTIQKEGYTLKDGKLVAQKGKKPSKSVEQVIAEASYNAADVTVNFKRGGRTSKVISQNGGIFFNPSVQGASKFVRNITEAVSDAKSGDFRAAKLLVARAAMLGVAPAILSEIMYGDDDEYKDIQDYQKDQYYIIKGEDGKWIRIPKGRAISLVQSATRRSIEKSQGRKDAFKGYGQLIENQIAPNNPLDNNIFSPITSAATNKSWSGNKIVSDSMAKRPVEEQFNEKTDEFSKWIGKKLHISPMKVNYVIDQYSGVLGDLALPQITPKATTGSSNPIMNILRDNYSFDAANSNKSLNDFYEIKSKIQTKARGMNATDKDKIQSKYLGTQSQEMYNLYTEKQKIQMDNSLSKKEKYDQALEVQKKINKKAKDAIKGSKDIDINKNYATVGDDTYYKDSGDWKKESEKTTQRREELGLTADKYYYYRNEEAYKKPDGKYKYITSGENAKRNIAIVDAFDFDTSDYLEYTYKLSQIKSDKNSSGKTIRNSRKPKVIKYIQSLPISKAQKEYLYKTQYSSYRSADSDLTKQISKSNLSKKEKEEIYSYLNLGR